MKNLYLMQLKANLLEQILACKNPGQILRTIRKAEQAVVAALDSGEWVEKVTETFPCMNCQKPVGDHDNTETQICLLSLSVLSYELDKRPLTGVE